MVEKTFFRTRSIAERRHLRRRRVYGVKNIVERVLQEIDPTADCLEVRAQLLPPTLQHLPSAIASRKNLRHGHYLRLPVPKTWEQAIAMKESPLELVAREIDSLHFVQPENLHFLGYQWTAPLGRGVDNRPRMAPFAFIDEAARLHAYMHQAPGRVKDYSAAQRVQREGAVFIVTIPSRTEKKQQYTIQLAHVPIHDDPARKASVWLLGTTQRSDVSEHELHQFGYRLMQDQRGSDFYMFYPQTIAAYFLIAATLARPRKANLIPRHTSPFAMPSKEHAEFYRRLLNNTLIYDAQVKAPEHLRPLHLDEISRLIGIYIARVGAERAIWYQDRDGGIKDYDYSIPR